MADKSKPITPGEVVQKKQECLPNEVIDAFNELIGENWDGRRSSFTVDEVTALIAKKLEMKNSEVPRRWLDLEPLYEKSGWHVMRHSPALGDNFATYFEFRQPRDYNF